MNKFNKDYVHFVADSALYGKYGYFSDNIDYLMNYVNNTNLRQWDMLGKRESDDSSFPFVKGKSDTSFRFFYHDPSWDGRLLPADSRIVTHRELAKWLARGNGEYCYTDETGWQSDCYTEWGYLPSHAYEMVNNVVVRRWEDDEWHEPTSLYLGLDR